MTRHDGPRRRAAACTRAACGGRRTWRAAGGPSPRSSRCRPAANNTTNHHRADQRARARTHKHNVDTPPPVRGSDRDAPQTGSIARRRKRRKHEENGTNERGKGGGARKRNEKGGTKRTKEGKQRLAFCLRSCSESRCCCVSLCEKSSAYVLKLGSSWPWPAFHASSSASRLRLASAICRDDKGGL